MLAPDGNPSLDNIQQILGACGLAFAVVPKERLKSFVSPESKTSSEPANAPLQSQLTEIAGDLAKIGGQLKSVAKQLYRPASRKTVLSKRRKAR